MNSKLYLFLFCFFLCSCAFPTYKYSESIRSENENSISKKIQICKTTNINVLEIYGRPYIKHVYSNGCYRYTYHIYDQKVNGSIISLIAKAAIFEFDKNGRLIDFIFKDNSLGDFEKMDTVNLKRENMFDWDGIRNKYYNISIGSAKANIFTVMGKPLWSRSKNGNEVWIYMSLYPRTPMEILDSSNRYMLMVENVPGIFYAFEFKNNKLVDKYFYQMSLMDDIEKKYK